MALAQPKVNAQGFTAEEAAELEQADKEIAELKEQSADEGGEEQQVAEQEVQTQETEPKAKDGDKTRPPHGYVPQQALHEIRKELQEEREKRARMEGAWQQIQQRLSGPQQQSQQPQHQAQGQPGQVPDYNVDPLGHLKSVNEQLMSALMELRGQHQQHSQATQQQNQYMQVMNRYASDWSAFARTTPDAVEAYNWIKGDAEAEIEARFPGIDAQHKAQLLQAEEENIIANAYSRGKNPAQIIYDLAKRRGYKGRQPAQEENKLERLAKGQKASASLQSTKGAAGAGGSPETMSLATLSELMASSDPADQAKADEMWDTMARRGLLG